MCHHKFICCNILCVCMCAWKRESDWAFCWQFDPQMSALHWQDLILLTKLKQIFFVCCFIWYVSCQGWYHIYLGCNFIVTGFILHSCAFTTALGKACLFFGVLCSWPEKDSHNLLIFVDSTLCNHVSSLTWSIQPLMGNK